MFNPFSEFFVRVFWSPKFKSGKFCVGGGACVVGSYEKVKVGVAKDVSAFRFIQSDDFVGADAKRRVLNRNTIPLTCC